MPNRAFVSSTFVDLKDHRAHVISSLRRAGFSVDPMEDWTADSDEPKKFSQDRLNGCDLCVLLVAFRRGYVPDGEALSITQLEYQAAIKEKIDVLPFMLDDDAPWRAKFDERDKDPEIARWREALRKRHGVQPFNLEPQSIDMTGPLTRWVEKRNRQRQAELPRTETSSDRPQSVAPQTTWDIDKEGSPYPGLMHFTRKYARVFFGRDDEIREIIYRIHKPEGRFIIISGDSGVGKSSVVDAGILPRLDHGGLPGSESCITVRMVPGQGSQPFESLMMAVGSFATRAGLRPDDIVKELKKSPDMLTQHLRKITADGAGGKRIVLFLDQMEELFTAQGFGQPNVFLAALYRAAQAKSVWVIATIRSDFLHYCHEHDDLLKVLRGSGYYPLGRVETYMMPEIIVKPAQSAGLTIPDRLVRRLTQEAGSEPGSLPLLAFALERLSRNPSGNVLSENVYDALGGIAGAIGARVSKVEERVTAEFGVDANARLHKIFQSLVVINIEGQPTRRRVLKQTFAPDLQPIVDLLSKERLFSAEGEGQQSTVSVAHEKLFEAWPTLTRWVAENREDLFVLRQAEIEAREWAKHEYDLKYLWHSDRVVRLREIVHRVGAHGIDAALREYVAPQDRLIERLHADSLSHVERLSIGNYLAALGDLRRGVGLTGDGLPDIDWVDISEGKVKLEEVKKAFEVKRFRISRYLVTNIQFEAFIKAANGYRNELWWKDIEQSQQFNAATWNEGNYPRAEVSWYEAVAFCRWLSACLGRKIRLPTEWEWQQAATAGDAKNVYPWDSKWNAARCNSQASDLRRTTAVGVYPNGATRQGVLDMAGNVWEWCVNKYDGPDTPESLRIAKDERSQRVLRGGSWGGKPGELRASFRNWNYAFFRGYGIGFRLAQDIE